MVSPGIQVAPGVELSEDELRFSASRSSGPGGQHVNKVASRVTLRFDFMNSASLDQRRKELIRSRLAGRINRRGELVVHCQIHRSFRDNRKEAVRILTGLLARALHESRPRGKTRIPRRAHQERLRRKRARAEIKRTRRRVR